MDNLDRAIWMVLTKAMPEPVKNNDCKILVPRIKTLIEREIGEALSNCPHTTAIQINAD